VLTVHTEQFTLIEVVDPFYLRLSDKVAHLDDKVYRFFAWKERLGRDPDTMGGQ